MNRRVKAKQPQTKGATSGTEDPDRKSVLEEVGNLLDGGHHQIQSRHRVQGDNRVLLMVARWLPSQSNSSTSRAVLKVLNVITKGDERD